MSAKGYLDLAELETRFNEALDRRRGAAEGRLVDGPAEAVVRAQLRWAVWCLECLRELRDLVDMTDARGLGDTRQGYRAEPTAMGHVMWASTTAMGALDRAAAAFGAIHFGIKMSGRVHDLGELLGRRKDLPVQHSVGDWLDAVQRDAAYGDLLGLLRNPLVHRTTPMALFARAGGSPVSWEDSPPHQDDPAFYIPGRDLKLDPMYRRSVTVVDFLDEVNPSVHRHIERAVDLIQSGAAF
jgi:hypothetical protein